MTENTTVYVNAVVFDGLADAPLHSAFAVRGDRILAVGTDDDVRAAAGPDAAVVDLGGAFAMPGVIEAHAHLAMFGHAQGKVQLRDCTSVEQIQQRLREAREANPDAEIIEGVRPARIARFLRSRAKTWRGRWPSFEAAGNSHGLSSVSRAAAVSAASAPP